MSDYLETTKYHTDPHRIDSDGGGIDDFNEIYTYQTDPNDPSDDKEIIEKIPNVEARGWTHNDGGIITSGSDAWSLLFTKPVIISMRDPLIKWYAQHTEIEWYFMEMPKWYQERMKIAGLSSRSLINEVDLKGRRFGKILTAGEPIYKGLWTVKDWEGWERGSPPPSNPSYYFTHDRRGACIQSSTVNYVILSLKGYKCLLIEGKIPIHPDKMDTHHWVEVYIDGEVYIVNYNYIIPKDNFYKKKGWIITMKAYDPEWYEKEEV